MIKIQSKLSILDLTFTLQWISP